MKHNETSIKEDREYGSTIFKGSDKNGTYVVATVPKRANRIGKAMGTVNPSKPLNGEEVVGWVHSHGSSKSGSKDFNAFTSGGGDLIYGNNLGNKNIGFASYVITPGGFLNRAVTISQNIYWGTGTTTFQIQTIRNDLPSDPRDKFYENKTPYPINNSYTEEY